jgi:hypothetical protein
MESMESHEAGFPAFPHSVEIPSGFPHFHGLGDLTYVFSCPLDSNHRHRKGLVTNVLGPQRNTCPGTLTPVVLAKSQCLWGFPACMSYDIGKKWHLAVRFLRYRKIDTALFGGPPRARPAVLPMPDFADLHQQRQRHSHLTQQLLWEEYRQANPDGYRYSRFCELHQRWRRKQDVVLRQEHRGVSLSEREVDSQERARPAATRVADVATHPAADTPRQHLPVERFDLSQWSRARVNT